jgi:hypothetical protein
MLAAPKAFVSHPNTPSTPEPMKTHTPGPWRLDPHGCGDSPAIVRVFPCGDSEPIAVPINSGFAELQLMSSAPDLLASLIELESMVAEMLPKHGPCGWGELALNQAREAIAKAKGNE